MRHNRHAGFTLLEILIALFIFTILSIMMTGGLRTVINIQEGTERSAERMRKIEIVLVRMQRDLEQVVNRPVTNAKGQESSAFYGTPQGFVFTHGGMSGIASQHQVLQRTQYIYGRKGLWRMVWDVLDQAENSPKPNQREVLANVTGARFEYLDIKNVFHKEWPVNGTANQPLPRAVKVTLSIADWGSISQLYVIPAQTYIAPAKKPGT